MFSSPLINKMPVNLIQQPVERATVIIWLIAFAQFCNYGFISGITPGIGWYITAPVLMAVSVLVALRANNRLPLLVTFLSGAMLLLGIIDTDISVLLSHDQDTAKAGFMAMSIYSLVFWLLSRRLLCSRLFKRLQLLVQADHIADENVAFETFIFYLVFITLNSLVVLALFYPASNSQIVLLSSVVLLMISGNQLSAQTRGLILPIYVTLILVGILANEQPLLSFMLDLNTYGAVINNLTLALTSLAFLFWLSHNFLVTYFNRWFPKITFNTILWPWYGLLLFVFIALKQSPDSFFSQHYFTFILSYLFIMLRNTRFAIISWSIIALLSWLALVVLSPLNPQEFSLTKLFLLGNYGLQSLWFSIALITFSMIWDRHINPYLSHWGWQKVSFKKPVLMVSFVVAMVWLVINLILATGLVSGWYDLIKEGMVIEKTVVFVLLLFIALHFLINNNWLANLVHLSAMITIIILWGIEQPVPVYLMFALIHLLWVTLPKIITFIATRMSLPYPLRIINTAGIWIYISFLAAVLSLFQAMGNQVMVYASFVFLCSIIILFVASMVMIRSYRQQWWSVISHLLAVGLFLTLRFMFLGNAPVNSLDTMAIMLVSLALLLMNRFGLLISVIIPANVLVKLVPLTALFTLPWQIGSLHSSVTLLLLGLFYLLTANSNRLAVYTGIVLLNVAIYLWMPLLSNHTSLLLFYMIPVSVSLLLITHLHRQAIKPAQLNTIRFLALSLLYIVVTADIFISESLLIFLMGLLLGLSSIIYGITSRTRAFLYTGVSFMVIVIVGQLIAFYPDGRLGRALILMMSGAIITGSMIGFNIKREMLLEKIRVFRADLDSWR